MKQPVIVADYETLAIVLAEFRRAQRVSQHALADRLGCTPTAVSYYETGKRNAPGSTLFALAHALGFDLALIPRDDS